MTGRPLYYWDSPLFIAWITNESRPPGDMEGLSEVVRDFDCGKVALVTSTLTRLEVLGAKVGDKAMKQFRDFLDRPEVDEIAIDYPIIELAYEIRNYYQNSQDHQKTVSVPDAIHLATAINRRVSVFQTFDAENRQSTLGLIPLSEDDGVHKLKIVKPSASQIDVFAGR